MKERHGAWVHPFLLEPRAGDREIRMRPGKTTPIARGRNE